MTGQSDTDDADRDRRAIADSIDAGDSAKGCRESDFAASGDRPRSRRSERERIATRNGALAPTATGARRTPMLRRSSAQRMTIRDFYATGKAEGETWAEQDIADGKPTDSEAADLRHDAHHALETRSLGAASRNWAALLLGRAPRLPRGDPDDARRETARPPSRSATPRTRCAAPPAGSWTCGTSRSIAAPCYGPFAEPAAALAWADDFEQGLNSEGEDGFRCTVRALMPVT